MKCEHCGEQSSIINERGRMVCEACDRNAADLAWERLLGAAPVDSDEEAIQKLREWKS